MSKGHYRAMKELTLNLELNYCKSEPGLNKDENKTYQV